MGPAAQQFYVPDLLSILNLQSNTNPHEDVVRAETEKWVYLYGIFTDVAWDKFLESDVPRFASRTFFYADRQKLRDCSDFCLLMFALDDITDDEDKKKGTLTSQASIHAMQSNGPALSSSPAERMIKDYRARFFKATGPILQRRLLKGWEATFKAFPKELEVRESKEVLSIEEYTLIRRDSCALRMAFTHIEYALGIELPDGVYENPVFNELYLAALDMAWLLNDVYSYGKEHAKGQATWNYLTVVMHEKSGNLQTAADYSGVKFRELYDRFIDAKSRLPSWGKPLDSDVAAFLEGVGIWLAGTLRWCFEMPRYFGPHYEDISFTYLVDPDRKSVV